MGHAHAHPAPDAITLDAAFRWGVVLNVGYTVLEAAIGWWIGSLALLADAAHNLTDVAGLLIAWAAAAAAERPPTARFSYGFGRATILAAIANAIAILIGIGAVVWEEVRRLADPQPVSGLVVLLVALVGISVNTATALLFRRHRAHDLNAEGAFLHMAADAAVSAGVVLAAVVILTTGWLAADPVAALLVSLVIGWTAFGLLRQAGSLALDAVPSHVDRERVLAWLASRPGVVGVHDLHIWSLSTTRVGLTAHLVMPGGHPGDAFLHEIAGELAEHFGIDHAALQIELGDGPACRLAPDAVV
jgi:cobalt-zinc-cadmium efflux system protein